MSKQFIICYFFFSAFIGIYQPEKLLPATIFITEEQEEMPNRMQDESENEQQSEEQLLPIEEYPSLRATPTIVSYSIRKVFIPNTPPIPLLEPPPDNRS